MTCKKISFVSAHPDSPSGSEYYAGLQRKKLIEGGLTSRTHPEFETKPQHVSGAMLTDRRCQKLATFMIKT